MSSTRCLSFTFVIIYLNFALNKKVVEHSFVADNSLDYISSRTSGGSNADDNYERSSSSKTSQKLSFDHFQVVSPLKMVEGPVPDIVDFWVGIDL